MKHRIHKCILTLFSPVLLLCLLSGCSALTELVDRLGFDTYDYGSETVHTTHDPTGALAEELAQMLRILTPELREFDTMGEAIQAYRDPVLTHMLETEYARYSGNMDLIAEAAQHYPEYQITQIIPAADFEATMYRYFGGSVKISHRDGALFRYLKKVEAYISPSAPAPDLCEISILSLEETLKTYRVRFTVTQGEMTSDPYFVLIIKREDGTTYFKELTKETPAETVRETNPVPLAPVA